MLYTRHLKNLLKNYQQTLIPEEFGAFEKHVRSEVERVMKELAEVPAGADRGWRVLEMLDAEIAAASNVEVTCKRGCGTCCHLEVEITSDDAAVLEQAVLLGFEVDRERLARLAKRDHHSQEWRRGPVPENRCVFLGPEQECRVYEFRPGICRKTAVASDPTYCSEGLGMFFVPRVIPKAEVIMSAAISLPDTTHGPFAKQLSNRLEKKVATQLTALPSLHESDTKI